MNPKLEVRNLCFSYENKDVLRDLSFCVMPQEFVSILGASGGGKSTILNLLSGSLTPDSGEMLVDGKPIAGVSGQFAYMPQSDLLFDWQTILENVCLYGRIHGQYAAAREEALRLEAEQQAREKIARERAEQNRREQQEREERERNKKKSRGIDI